MHDGTKVKAAASSQSFHREKTLGAHLQAAQSYGFRPNRGCKDALRRVDTLFQAGYNGVVEADLKSYLDLSP